LHDQCVADIAKQQIKYMLIKIETKKNIGKPGHLKPSTTKCPKHEQSKLRKM